MEEPRRGRSVVLFALRFLVLVSIFTVGWWLLIPLYGWVLVQTAGATLKYVLDVPISYGLVDAQGILNTKSMLVLGRDAAGDLPPMAAHLMGKQARESSLAIALLVTNVAPYLALVCATLGLSWRRRAAILMYGLGILVLGHITYLVYALHVLLSANAEGDASAHLGEVPTAVTQLFLTLPFLLWIIFAYWDRAIAFLGEAGHGDARKDDGASPEV